MACSVAATNIWGSILAMSWPFLTWLLKSACSSAIRPETWLPTCTVTKADRVPVAVILAVMAPLLTKAVRTRWSSGSCGPIRRWRR